MEIVPGSRIVQCVHLTITWRFLHTGSDCDDGQVLRGKSCNAAHDFSVFCAGFRRLIVLMARFFEVNPVMLHMISAEFCTVLSNDSWI